MNVSKFGRHFLVLAIAALMLPLMGASTASAEVTTISARMSECKLNVDSYSVMLQTGSKRPVTSDIPTSVTLSFADGSTAQADRWSINLVGNAYYRLGDETETYRQVPLVSATAEFDVAKYPNYTFTVTGHPCSPTPEPEPTTAPVTGTIVQRGNERPVADLTVCLVEADTCTTTDASGNFAFSDVEYGTYTLTSDGNNWKLLTTSVTVTEGGVNLELIQFKGGGKGK